MSDLASIIIVTYNCQHYMKNCLDAVLKQDYPHEVIVADNASEDNTVQFVRENYPMVKVVETGADWGYGIGNNIGVKHASGKYIVILNPDTIVHDSWLRELITPIQGNEKVITTSKVLLWDGKSINTFGNTIHFSGLAFTTCLGENPDNHTETKIVSAISGASFALTKEAYEELNGFDKHFFLYHEDAEISWKAAYLGYPILAIPTSTLNHDYELRVSANKIYNLEKGRYFILRKYYPKSTVISLLPSLFVAEILSCGYAVKQGPKGVLQKIKGTFAGLKGEIDIETGNKQYLYLKLDKLIPTNQLTTNRLEIAVIRMANHIFTWNWDKFQNKNRN